METVSKELKYCPFCKSLDVEVNASFVLCNNCNAEGPPNLGRSAEEAWNTRAEDDLFLRVVRCLEYATYHDNRYSQRESEEWQTEAIAISKEINTRLGRKKYSTVTGEDRYVKDYIRVPNKD